MSTCGAEIEAGALMVSLLAGEEITIPVYDPENPEFDLPGDTTNPIYSEIKKLSIGLLTTREVGGTGSFDALMEGVKVHLKDEYDKNRITGAEYAKAYVALTQAAIGGAVQYLLGQDQAYWGGVQAQVAAITGRIQMRIATTELAVVHYKAKTIKAEYALSKMKLSTESVNYCIAQYQLASMLPMQLAKLSSEKAGQDIQNSTGQYQLASILPMQLLKMTTEKDGQLIQNNTAQYQLSSILPMQLGKMTVEKAGQELQNSTLQYQLSFTLPMQLQKLTSERDGQIVQNAGILVTNAVNTYNLENILPQQKINLVAQEKMTNEQMEAQRGQTADLRTDGTLIVGSIGKQKSLYDQQITSYKRDSEHKAAKLFTDAWITQKTLDEGLLAPAGFTNASLDGVLSTIKANNNLA